MNYWDANISVFDSPMHKGAEFFPSLEEISKPWIVINAGFSENVEAQHKEGKIAGGLYKLIPPAGWIRPCKDLNVLDGITNITGTDGARIEYFTKKSGFPKIWFKNMDFMDGSYSIQQFYEMAERDGPLALETNLNADEAIAKFEAASRFGKNGKTGPAFYISDFPANLFHGPDNGTRIDLSPKVYPNNTGAGLNFNDGAYDGLRAAINPYMKKSQMSGINTCTILPGCPFSSFCFHDESYSLDSVNYLHTGSPKIWIGVHPDDGKAVLSELKPYRRGCDNPLHHKDVYFTTQWLKSKGIKYDVIVQRAGEFVVTRAKAIHGGFNSSYNLAEATNFSSNEFVKLMERPKGGLLPICCCNSDGLDLSVEEMEKIKNAQRAINEGKNPKFDYSAYAALNRTMMPDDEKEKKKKDASAARKKRRHEAKAMAEAKKLKEAEEDEENDDEEEEEVEE